MFISLWDVKEPTHHSRRVGLEMKLPVSWLSSVCIWVGGYNRSTSADRIAAKTSTCLNKQTNNAFESIKYRNLSANFATQISNLFMKVQFIFNKTPKSLIQFSCFSSLSAT